MLLKLNFGTRVMVRRIRFYIWQQGTRTPTAICLRGIRARAGIVIEALSRIVGIRYIIKLVAIKCAMNAEGIRRKIGCIPLNRDPGINNIYCTFF